MISEPELTGGLDEPTPADMVSDGDPAPRPAAFGPGGRRLWAVGLGGAIVASAAWAGGLYAYGPRHSGAPDMHGYVLHGSPCAGLTLKPLTDALKATDTQTVSPAVVHLGPALDQIRCTIETTSPIPLRGGTARYEVVVGVDLHKATDPAAEFEDQRDLDTADLIPVTTTESVPDLGDKAYFLTINAGSQQLKVLDGGAVFTLTLNGYNYLATSVDGQQGDSTSETDLRAYQPALIATVRNVMKGQK
ncbi:hypothetical protein ACIQCJ_17455 [Streptomyces sp. NPDC093221]|uniref:hypothetical protein n=1 Tax=unclassified Streptomyces TaxID=2593676 RepID=UPI003815A071